MKIFVALVHLIFATTWLGSAFFYSVILQPKLNALPTAEQRALARSLRATMTPLLAASALLTIVSGLVMMVQLHSQHPGDAKPLLLAERESERGFVQMVLHILPESRPAEGGFHPGWQTTGPVHSQHARTERYILENRLGERIRLLKDHPYPPAEFRNVQIRCVEIPPVEERLSFNPNTGNSVVHTVEAP